MGTYKNIMELLVEEEAARQYKNFSTTDCPALNTEEVVACALNQLPSLYATSEQGLEYQIQRGRVKFAPQIRQAVQRSIATVLRDPLRPHMPLKQLPFESMGEVLQQVRQVLNNDEVQWETLPGAIEQAIQQAGTGPDRVNSGRQGNERQVDISYASLNQPIDFYSNHK